VSVEDCIVLVDYTIRKFCVQSVTNSDALTGSSFSFLKQIGSMSVVAIASKKCRSLLKVLADRGGVWHLSWAGEQAPWASRRCSRCCFVDCKRFCSFFFSPVAKGHRKSFLVTVGEGAQEQCRDLFGDKMRGLHKGV